MSEAVALPSNASVDRLLDGRLSLHQAKRGHRAGTDAVLLAASVRIEPGDVVVDVGAGVGTVGLALAVRDPGLVGMLLEVDPATAILAAENCHLNAVEGRMRVVTCDLFDASARRAAGLAGEAATLVVTNPPYLLGTETRLSPDAGRARAHALSQGSTGHADWLKATLSLLAPRGRCHLIHRPEVLPALLAGCDGRLGALALMPVHARADGPAIRILLAGVKGSRAPLRICAPLVLHEKDGAFTPLASALHRGERLIPL